MIFSGDFHIEMVSIAPLSPAIIGAWASKPVWYWREAVKLSINCSPDPTTNEVVLSDEESLVWGVKFRNRGDETERAMMTGELPYIRIPYSIDDEKTFPAFRPLEFVNWLRRSNLPHPPELYDGVRKYHARELRESDREPRYLFRKKLQAWEVRFGDIVLDGIKDLLGMAFIQLLLQHQEPIRVSEMQGLAGIQSALGNTDNRRRGNTDSSQAIQYEAKLQEHGEGRQEVLDDEARQQYRDELERLEVQYEFAEQSENHAEITRIRREMAFIQQELNAATGLHGQSRQLNATDEKYRKSTAKAIKEAIDNIRSQETREGHQNSPIAAHLTKCIKKGVTCYYDNTLNNPPIEWYF